MGLVKGLINKGKKKKGEMEKVDGEFTALEIII